MEFKLLPDYPVFKKLADALWQPANAPGGAAVMVGSGFSRCAAENADPNLKMPLWSDFTERVKTDLGMEETSHIDPLKVAEEYRVHFSQNALNGLIEQVVNNSAWQPGEMYRDLLKFSWREVLTTNWDTLLERATKQYQSQHFQVVRKPSDLTHTVAPRITKLHGTIGFSEKYIVTEEDYRTYPQQFGIFVNFVRQVLIENALCLIGFSGDDPNFLQWLGWIRDNLQERAHNIYLVGMLKLSPSKRRYFESLNISPIDLEPLVSDIYDTDTQHKRALALFFDALEGEEPEKVWEWQTSKDKWNEKRRLAVQNGDSTDSLEYEKLPVEQVTTLLKQNRETYPRWFVTPVDVERSLYSCVSRLHINSGTLEGLLPKIKAEFLYEVVWHYQQTAATLDDFLVRECHQVLQPAFEAYLSEGQRKDIALELLKNQYWDDGKDEDLNAIYSHAREQVEAFTHLFPEAELELLYRDAIVARDAFDYEQLKILLARMEKRAFANKPVWAMRRAALYAELGDFNLSKTLVSGAFKELDSKIKQQPHSMYILSIWSWCGYLDWAYSKRFERVRSFQSSEFAREAKCDFKRHFDEVDHWLIDLEKRYIKENISPVEPEFKSGEAKDHRNTVYLRSVNRRALTLIHHYAECIGLPMFGLMTGILNQKSAKACFYAENFENLHIDEYFILALRAANGGNDELIKKQFSRLAVARIPLEIMASLFQKLIRLLDYWLSRFEKENKRLDNFEAHSMVGTKIAPVIEILARITVRLNEQQSLDLYFRAVKLAEHPVLKALSMYQPYGHLVAHSLESIPKPKLNSVVLASLKFPFAEEQESHLDWPNPVITHVSDIALTQELIPEIISELQRLIYCLDESSKHRNTAILERLLPFCEAGVLDEETKAALVNKLWDTRSEIKVAIETNFLDNGLLRLACPDPEQYRRRITGRLFAPEKLEIEAANTNLFGYITIFAKDEYHPILPTSVQAEFLFSKIVEWIPEQQEDTGVKLYWDAQKELEALANQVAWAMSFSFVPCLPQAAFTEENYNLLKGLKAKLKQQKLAHTALLPALVEFAVRLSTYREPVAKEIQYAMAIERDGFANAAEAILCWLDKSTSKKLHPKVSDLRDLLVAGVSPVSNTTNLKFALWGCVQLEEKGNLSSLNIEYLVDVLPVLFDAYDYQNFNPYTEEAVAPPVVKKWLVKLARRLLTRLAAESEEECDLSALNDLIDTAKRDALPEVRFEAMEG